MRTGEHIFTNMVRKFSGASPFFVSVVAVITVTAAIIICVITFGGSKINFKSEFYFVCYFVRDNIISADSLSDTVESYGGAGYVLKYAGKYYVTVSCYYTENDAKGVQQSLLRRGIECSVLSVETDEYHVNSYGSKANENLFLGNLNTLYSLSKLCYECANGLDTGEYNQAAAKGVLADVERSLNGLKSANSSNCFSGEIRRLLSECEAAKDGFIYSKNMRKLQIAIADTVINIDLY